jgi:predicted transcriptional regulator
MRADPRRSRERREETTQATILSMLLDSHPVARTMPELVRVLDMERDEINRALCALADYGLLDFEGGKSETLRPSLAARSCRRLIDCRDNESNAQGASVRRGLPISTL